MKENSKYYYPAIGIYSQADYEKIKANFMINVRIERMKVKLKSYAQSENGLSIQLMPETDVEVELLNAIFRHGEMRTGHPCDAKGNTGYYLSWKIKEAEAKMEKGKEA